MPKIFELFGFPITVNTEEATYFRKTGLCPFMNCSCDGGGNRFASHIDLTKNKDLENFFGNKKIIPSGVCSIQMKESQTPWIVCPRRLFVLGREDVNFKHSYQKEIEKQILSLSKYPKNSKIGVWAEIKLRLSESSIEDEEQSDKTFQYSFDYILMPLVSLSQYEVVKVLGGNWNSWRKIMINSGYSIARRNEIDFIEDFPYGIPYIIEVMTSSTSGGNKLKRSTIPLSFEDAILGKPHNAPGINKRQVWARMVSQLIVKSEVSLNWGGNALWLVQDNLADYISTSTALNLNKFISTTLSEINIMSFTYKNAEFRSNGMIELKPHYIFSGPISANEKNSKASFSDLIRTSFSPPIKELITVLAGKRRVNELKIL